MAIAEEATSFLGSGVDAHSQALGKIAEVLDENAAGAQAGFHNGKLEEMAQCATQSEAIEAGQNACVRVAESVKKG